MISLYFASLLLPKSYVEFQPMKSILMVLLDSFAN